MNEEILGAEIGTGALQSPEDYRYVNLGHLAGAIFTSLPDTYHIDYSKVPDLNQRKIGACTAHAASEIRMHRRLRKAGSTPVFSPRFVYALSKGLDGVLPLSNQGTYPVMPLKMGVKYGFATTNTIDNNTLLSFDEYVYNRDVTKIPQEAYQEARKYKIPGYVQVGQFKNITEQELKTAIIKSDDGVNITMPVGKEWWTSADGRISWNAKDILPIRHPIKVLSGHDITATGYEMENGRCKIFFRNEWGHLWANDDNGWFYLDQHTLSEAWMITTVPKHILKVVKSLPKKEHFAYHWDRILFSGMTGIDVQFLQIALKILKVFPFEQPVTEYYGPITQSAVTKFQTEYGVASPQEILAARGAMGPKTKAVLNNLFK